MLLPTPLLQFVLEVMVTGALVRQSNTGTMTVRPQYWLNSV